MTTQNKIILFAVIIISVIGNAILFISNQQNKKALSLAQDFSNQILNEAKKELTGKKKYEYKKIDAAEKQIDSLQTYINKIQVKRTTNNKYYKNEIKKTDFSNTDQRNRYADSVSNTIKD